MRVAVTRPEADGERTARALRAAGHAVLLAPLMRVEPVPADLSGEWAGLAVTSANALTALSHRPEWKTLRKLPVYAVGRRSAAAAEGFAQVHAADGDVHDLARLIARQHPGGGQLLYVAGEDRAADLVGGLAEAGIHAELRVIYRTVSAPLAPALVTALRDGGLDAVLHFSRRSAENFVGSAQKAGVLPQALTIRHVCISAQVAQVPLAAGAAKVCIAPHADEASLIALLSAP